MLENELLQIMLLPDKGGEPVRWLHKPTDTDLIWHTRMGVQPMHPLFSDYQMSYMGGWQEMLPEVSETHQFRGALLHRGESAVTPWTHEILQDDPLTLKIRLTNRLRSLPLVVEKTIIMRAGDASVRMEETVWNEAAVPIPFNWGHHLAYGAPFLSRDATVTFPPGSKVLNPRTGARCDWPDAPGAAADLSHMAAPGTLRELLAIETPEGVYRVRGGHGAVELEVKWDAHIWPYVWYWQNFANDCGAPFFACEYNIGLEPFNVPPKWTLAEAADKGASLLAPPLGSVASYIEIHVHNKEGED